MTEGTKWPTVDPTPDVEGIDISKGPGPAARRTARSKAEMGVHIRIALGDPDGSHVAQRVPRKRSDRRSLRRFAMR
jgi:hypothetical protein